MFERFEQEREKEKERKFNITFENLKKDNDNLGNLLGESLNEDELEKFAESFFIYTNDNGFYYDKHSLLNIILLLNRDDLNTSFNKIFSESWDKNKSLFGIMDKDEIENLKHVFKKIKDLRKSYVEKIVNEWKKYYYEEKEYDKELVDKAIDWLEKHEYDNEEECTLKIFQYGIRDKEYEQWKKDNNEYEEPDGNGIYYCEMKFPNDCNHIYIPIISKGIELKDIPYDYDYYNDNWANNDMSNLFDSEEEWLEWEES